MEKIIEKIQPRVSTLCVELKVIQIGNKQFTAAVFNQLYKGRCYDDSYNITHLIWGKVNYKDEEWIVFQIDSGLRRQKIDTCLNEIITPFEYWIEEWMDNFFPVYGENQAIYKWGDVRRQLYSKVYEGGNREEITALDANNISSLRVLQKYFINDPIIEILENNYLNRRAIKEKRKALYDSLVSLEQLFIAI